MITSEKNYFDFADTTRQKSYESIVFAQLAHTMFMGSLDDTNAGRVRIQDEKGEIKEIIRTDYRQAFKNATFTLYQLVVTRMDKEYIADLKPWANYADYRHNFSKILKHLHKSGLFGKHQLMVVWDWKLERERVKEIWDDAGNFIGRKKPINGMGKKTDESRG